MKKQHSLLLFFLLIQLIASVDVKNTEYANEAENNKDQEEDPPLEVYWSQYSIQKKVGSVGETVMKYLDKPCKKELYQSLVGLTDVISPNCLKQVTKVLIR